LLVEEYDSSGQTISIETSCANKVNILRETYREPLRLPSKHAVLSSNSDKGYLLVMLG